jgi:acetylglutamate kinase
MFETVITLKRAIPYIRLYKGRTFVVKVGGQLLQRKELLDDIAADLTLLHQVGIQIVLIHGGGPQASELCKKLGIEPQIVAGRRITDEPTLEVAKMVYAGTLNINILTALRRHGTPAVGISGVDGQLLTARRREKKEIQPSPQEEPVMVDFGFVGDIEHVNVEFLQFLLGGGQVPVISSFASDDEGNLYNVNADTVAQYIATALQAEKLMILTDTDGVLGNVAEPSSLISYTDIEEIEQLKQQGKIVGGMLPKVDACTRALKGGVRRTHILNGSRAGALLVEIFTNGGCGTMIVNQRERQSYQQSELQEPTP